MNTVPGTDIPANTGDLVATPQVIVEPLYIAPEPIRAASGVTGGSFIGGNTKTQTTVTTNYADSFNQTDSNVTSTSDSGNVSLTLGGAGNVADGVLPLILGVGALLGALWLFTRGGK